MVPDRIAFANVMRYRRKIDLDLSGLRVVGISGMNESGKSTILDVLAYNAFGRTARDGLREVDLVADPGDGDLITQVRWRFPDSSMLDIERGRTRKNEAILNVAGLQTRNASEAEEAIAERVQASFEDFRTLTYFAQGQVHGFMEGDKREHLSRWTSGLAVWSEMEELAKRHLTESTASRDEAAARAARLEAVMEQQSQSHACQRQAESALFAAEDAVQRIQRRIDRLTESVAKARAERARGIEAAEAVEDLEAQADDMDREVAAARGRVGKAKLNLSKVSSGRCPILGIRCGPLRRGSGGGIKEAEEEVARARKSLGRVTTQRDALHVEVERIVEDASCIPSLDKRGEDLLRRHAALRARRKEITNRQRDAARELAEAKVARKDAESAGDVLEGVQAEVEELEAEASRWRLLRTMCGKSGVPSEIIEGELEHVEEKANWVLQKLGADKEVVFRAYRLLVGYEKMCEACGAQSWHKSKCRECGEDRPRKRREDLTVSIRERGKERSFASQSGGAKVLVSFAVRFAAALFRASVAGLPMRFAALDEVFGALDSERRRAMMKLVVGRLSSEFGLERQLVVSHHEDVVGSIDNLLLVRSTSSGSIVEWA